MCSNSQPILSIVIANYNYGRFISQAIESVLSQKCPDVELIVIDGGSTDDSVECIKRYADGLSAGKLSDIRVSSDGYINNLVYWISEKDGGQSNAFNKGFAVARGKYLTWLNADDIMVDGALVKIVAAMRKHPKCEWFTGNFYRFIDGTGKVSEIGWGPHYYPVCLQFRNSPIVVFGPTSFFSRDIYERVGKIDERFHMMMDTDLWVRFMAADVKQRRIACYCWAFRMHKDSKTAEFGDHRLDAKRKAQFAFEMSIMQKRTPYMRSWLLHLLLNIWRIVDGSLLLRWLYSCGIMRIRGQDNAK